MGVLEDRDGALIQGKVAYEKPGNLRETSGIYCGYTQSYFKPTFHSVFEFLPILIYGATRNDEYPEGCVLMHWPKTSKYNELNLKPRNCAHTVRPIGTERKKTTGSTISAENIWAHEYCETTARASKELHSDHEFWGVNMYLLVRGMIKQESGSHKAQTCWVKCPFPVWQVLLSLSSLSSWHLTIAQNDRQLLMTS